MSKIYDRENPDITWKSWNLTSFQIICTIINKQNK